MMSLLEYAEDMDLNIEEVKKLCDKLGIVYKNEESILTEENIIMLDNELGEESYDDNKDIEEEMLMNKTDDKSKKVKIIPKFQQTGDFKKDRKSIYKHRDKLKSNKELEKDIIIYKNNMTVKELAEVLEVNANEIVKKLMNLGVMASLNQSINYDVAELLVIDYDKKLKKEEEADIANFEELVIEDKEEDLVKRAPVVTIMGHVDHGKTSLLDVIRKTNVVAKEAGGITQGISSYKIKYKNDYITFIDTPGHAAFTEMRARGAAITDIIIIIVAADDGIKPQTEEVIDHAKAAGVPIIVAINKIDKPDANPEKVKTALVEAGLTPEEWGGNTIINLVSALKGTGIEELLDNILLVAEMANLKANPNRYALGTVIEARKDANFGVIATLLVQNGTLRLGDPIVVGEASGKVRTLKNDLGEDIIEAIPSTPVEITGLDDLPDAGDKFMAFEKEKEARNVASRRKVRASEENTNKSGMSLEDLFGAKEKNDSGINVVLKTDMKGSLEAIKQSLLDINVDNLHLNIVRGSVGAISESDIVLAKATKSIVLGFNVRPTKAVSDYAKKEQVDIRLYDVIYNMIDDITEALKGKLSPEYEEEVLGTAEIRQIFKFSKIGNIAGCHVIDGTIKAGSKMRLVRDGVVVYSGEMKSLQHGKDQIKEVTKDKDCGITFDYQDFKVGDLIEVYVLKEIKK